MELNQGILLAGGTGSRLSPLTNAINKHLLSVSDKFIIDYSLETLINLGCKTVFIILGGNHYEQVIKHLQDGSSKNIKIVYIYQGKPLGIAQAINLCSDYITGNFAVVLGDNIFDGEFTLSNSNNAQIFLTTHPNLNNYGVASISNNKICKLEEKPSMIDHNFENYAISGLYVFTKQYFDYFKNLKPSNRNEFEIVDIIKQYLSDNNLDFSMFSGIWSDARYSFNITIYSKPFLYEG